MAYKQRKNAQKKFNAFVRQVNKEIEKDELWLGRFYIHQLESYWQAFEDGSGGILVIKIQYIDKKTGKSKIDWVSMCSGWHTQLVLFEQMNSFIVDYCKVWDENPSPSIHNTEDFRGKRREIIYEPESEDLHGFEKEYLCRW